MTIPEMLREGYESYRRYVNPLVTLRAELLGEPTRITGVRDGQLVLPTIPSRTSTARRRSATATPRSRRR